MSSRWGRHGPGTTRGDPHASWARVLLDADSSRGATRNEAVSACGFLFFCFGSAWDGAQDLGIQHGTVSPPFFVHLVGFAPVKCTSRVTPPCTRKRAKE